MPNSIYVSTELDLIEKNYPLLILAKGEKLLDFFEEVVRKGLTEYIEIFIFLSVSFDQTFLFKRKVWVEILFQVGVSIDPETLTEGVRRMKEWSPEFKANLERALENLFEFSPGSIERIAPFRRALEEQRRVFEEQRRVLEEQRRVLEEQRRVFEERERNTKREDLILLLESKFGSLSEKLVSQFEAVHDVDELTQLYKRALQAKTLEEIGLQNE